MRGGGRPAVIERIVAPLGLRVDESSPWVERDCRRAVGCRPTSLAGARQGITPARRPRSSSGDRNVVLRGICQMPRGGAAAPQWADHGSDRTIVVESTLFNGEVASPQGRSPVPTAAGAGTPKPVRGVSARRGREERARGDGAWSRRLRLLQDNIPYEDVNSNEAAAKPACSFGKGSVSPSQAATAS